MMGTFDDSGVNTLRILLAAGALAAATPLVPAADDYQLGPDSFPKDGVPRGTVTKHEWRSEIFPGTVRDYWVYVPAQYQARGNL